MHRKKTINKKKVAPKRIDRPVLRKIGRRPPRLLGVKDIIPTEHFYLSQIESRARQLAQAYSFSPISTPILENLSLYKKSSRRGNDKDFYMVDWEKGETIVLRPEMTQGILRAYFENNLDQLEQPTRLFSLGSIFRREKLQSGKYRESRQFNLEIIGEDKPMAEALLISLINNLLKELKVGFEVQINSLGKADCRQEYANKLRYFYKQRGRRSRLCNLCRKSLSGDILALLDCRQEDCLKIAEETPPIADCLSEESQQHFKKVLEYLDDLKISYNFNPHLVRGLNYYNDTVFEFWPLGEAGKIQGKLALAGGGRYDNLATKFGGEDSFAVGLALGLERLMAKIKDKISIDDAQDENLIFIAQLGEQAKIKSMLLFEELRQAGYLVRQSFTSNSLKNQMEEAASLKAKISLILGKKEVSDETIIFRDMESGSQEIIAYKKIKDKLSKKINRKEGVFYG